MSDCGHDCENCEENCPDRKKFPKEKTNELSSVKKVVAVISGKGGVGKSAITSMLAVLSERRGCKTAILDADITGPSIPAVFGIAGKAEGGEGFIFPEVSAKGIKVMSMNLLLEDVSSPVVWRGPILATAVKQFWTDVVWGEVDYMFVDMPPGTGDVPLTIFQSIPVDGIIVVTTPQCLVGMIVDKAVKMAKMLDIPILGIVENMSYFKCPECGARTEIFGKSKVGETAERLGVRNVARLPFEPEIAKLSDKGLIELVGEGVPEEFFDAVEKTLAGA